MEGKRAFKERRQHERARVQNIVLGILNSGKLDTIGSITDISLGGLRYTYNELRVPPDDNPIHSVDLVAEDHFLFDIPCTYAWKVRVDKKGHAKLRNLRQCGIQFGKLTPNQMFLLKSFMNRFASPSAKSLPSEEHTAHSK